MCVHVHSPTCVVSACFYVQCVHSLTGHSREVITVKWDRWSHCLYSQGTKSFAFFFFHFHSVWRHPIRWLSVNLGQVLIYPLWKCPHRHTQRCCLIQLSWNGKWTIIAVNNMLMFKLLILLLVQQLCKQTFVTEDERWIESRRKHSDTSLWTSRRGKVWNIQSMQVRIKFIVKSSNSIVFFNQCILTL